MTATELIKVGDLKPLKALYPRQEVSSAHILELSDALRAGAEFPPLLVNAETREIVDGRHRWGAYLVVKGREFLVPCILKTYTGEGALFEDAVRENARHGLRFTEADQGRVVSLALSLKLKATDLVPVLRMTVTRMKVVRAEYLTAQPRAGSAPSLSPEKNMPRMRRPTQRTEAAGAQGGYRPPKRNEHQARAEADAASLALLLESKTVDSAHQLRQPLAQLRYALAEFLGVRSPD